VVIVPPREVEFLVFDKKWGSILLLPVVALIAVTIDQLAKRIVTASLVPGQSWAPFPALENLFSMTMVTNTGAAFGLFPGLGAVFMVVAIVVVVVIAIYYWHMPEGQFLIKLSLGLQLGGALGNLLDRLRFGYVIDFIDFKIWPVFNLADASIVLGVALLAYALLWDPGERNGPVPERNRDTI
jgi:signal peptidase II